MSTTTARPSPTYRLRRLIALGAVAVTCMLAPAAFTPQSADQSGDTSVTSNHAAMRCFRGEC